MCVEVRERRTEGEKAQVVPIGYVMSLLTKVEVAVLMETVVDVIVL